MTPRRSRRSAPVLARVEQLERRELLHGGELAAVQWSAEGEASAAAMTDFSLRDVNPASVKYNQQVSPRDYLDQISAWYFGHAT